MSGTLLTTKDPVTLMTARGAMTKAPEPYLSNPWTAYMTTPLTLTLKTIRKPQKNQI